MADVYGVHSGLLGHEQGQPVAEVDEVHPPLQPGRSNRGDLFHSGTGVLENGLAQPHSLHGAGVVFRRVEEQGGHAVVSAFPTDQFVVVHLWKNVMVAESLGVLIELLAPADQDRF